MCVINLKWVCYRCSGGRSCGREAWPHHGHHGSSWCPRLSQTERKRDSKTQCRPPVGCEGHQRAQCPSVSSNVQTGWRTLLSHTGLVVLPCRRWGMSPYKEGHPWVRSKDVEGRERRSWDVTTLHVGEYRHRHTHTHPHTLQIKSEQTCQRHPKKKKKTWCEDTPIVDIESWHTTNEETKTRQQP